MVRHDDVNQAWTVVDEATNALGARVQELIDQINATAGEGLNGPQTEALLANLAGLATRLNGMGKNGEVPPVDDGEDEPLPIPGPFADDAQQIRAAQRASRGQH